MREQNAACEERFPQSEGAGAPVHGHVGPLANLALAEVLLPMTETGVAYNGGICLLAPPVL
jgi:hypothetical protein